VKAKSAYDTFEYRRGVLHAEGVSLESLAAKVGTPFYVYSAAKIRRQFQRWTRAYAGHPHTVCYAMKANSNLAVVALLARQGAGVDIVSGGELFRALRAGVEPSRVVFSGVGKTAGEIQAALLAGILAFNVESPEELETIHRVAERVRRRAPVSFRVNPDVAVDTHHKITTGKAENKFGVAYHQAEGLYIRASRMPWVQVVGIQAHIGSQILDVRPYKKTLEKLLALVDRLAALGIHLHMLDLGGGLGVTYDNAGSPDPSEKAALLLPMLRGRGLRLLFEPGRFLVAEAGALVTRVLYRKEPGHKNFVIVDAAMNDLARPALYDAHHPVWPVRRIARPAAYTADVVGPICESGDYMAKKRALTHRPDQGDLLALMVAGAYGFAMSSQYNARPRVPEILVDGKKWWVVRERENLEDLVRGERIPAAFR
jgi:diaminopimelate decarboxylase